MLNLKIALFLQLLIFSLAERQERLLINDPAYTDQRIRSLESQVQQLVTTVQQQANDIQILKHESKGGVLYIRWGKETCPNRTDVETVYSGFVGGSGYSTKGGSSKYYCLPKDPELSDVTVNGFLNHMYGTEYESNYPKAGAFNEDAPCSVCLSKWGTNILMIPGRKSCHSGWKMEYFGNLVGNDDSAEAAYEYVCLDSDPDYLQAGQGNTDGAWMCPVVTKCGTLPCPPYTNAKPMSCVVCSK